MKGYPITDACLLHDLRQRGPGGTSMLNMPAPEAVQRLGRPSQSAFGHVRQHAGQLLLQCRLAAIAMPRVELGSQGPSVVAPKSGERRACAKIRVVCTPGQPVQGLQPAYGTQLSRSLNLPFQHPSVGSTSLLRPSSEVGQGTIEVVLDQQGLLRHWHPRHQ
jgi:hypothetical protein